MAKRLHLRHGDHHRREDGNALVVAVMVTAVCLSLALVGVQTGITAGRSSGVDRQRLLAINAAESGVDGGYSAIQRGLLNPPCSASSANVRSGPDVASYTTSITYYDANGASLNASCSGTPPVLPSNAAPVRALITSAATTNTLGGGTTKGNRTMQALVNLSPVNGNSMKKAIFAQGNLGFSNQTTVTGGSGADADIYSNTSVDCSNNENFAGSVYSQGSISISNKCTFAGNVWAAGSVTTNAGSNGTVAGFVKAGTGVINLSGINVTGNLTAGSTISYGGCSAAGKCYPNSSPGAPQTVPFPILRGDAATMDAWRAGAPTATPPVAAFTVVYDTGSCSTVDDRIQSTYSKASTPTLVRTSCAVSFAKAKTIPLSNDLAIFADGGFSSSNQVGFSSSVAGTSHNLYWVQPYDAVPHPCTSTGISTDQQFSLTDDVNMFLYSACNIAFANSSHHIGQIYGGGNVQINNQFNLQFKEVGVVGIDPASQPTVGYNASVVYKRETR